MIGLKNMRYYPLFVIVGLFIITRFIKVPKEQKKKSKSIDEKEKKTK